ncbi:hypothetical protein SAMN05428961_105198 [Paenibacillus sp. OK060]|jgi:hypothetical protein|uniref:DUF600 domain-containing protein n=1 Tax=Paenibacillus pabuli TaxID=1472 RepID=A0ABX9BSW1_9BACL|nr:MULTISPECIES: hypothetical protein [Paenibacillus]RAJ03223.1 hypothetical protein DET54_101418 [Paenibacillus pabuli]SDL47060.1 hypothetical protein SAMN05428961_105198 [Paenibacillus sp. OK060]
MGKVFEDYFSELQSDIVSICLEYVDKRADVIYICCYHELGEYGMDVFYKINDVFVEKHKVNEIYSEIDVSEERQYAVLRIGNEDLLKIINLFEKYNREMPTEMKLTYDVIKNKLEATYSYDLKFTNLSKSASEVFDEWFEEVSRMRK